MLSGSFHPLDLLLTEFLATALMTGIIWFVQVVHYPLFLRIPSEGFVAYEEAHTSRTTWIVAPLMLVELGSALALFFPWTGDHLPPVAIDPLHLAALALLALIWASTFFIQVPLHGILSARADTEIMRRLVATNWIRTIFWTVRLVLLAFLARGILRT
jgi:hypothetical protein